MVNHAAVRRWTTWTWTLFWPASGAVAGLYLVGAGVAAWAFVAFLAMIAGLSSTATG